MGKRENGGGTIRTVKGANGTRYYAYAPARYEQGETGTRCIRQPLGAYGKKADAKRAIENYIQKPTQKYNHSIEQLYREWAELAFPEISRQTQDNYRAAWRQITAAWGEKTREPIRDRTTAEIAEIYRYWLEPHTVTRQGRGKAYETTSGPLSKSAMQKIKALLTQLYAYAMANDILAQNYASLVKIPRDAEEGKKRAFTDLEFAKLEKGWETTPGGDACLVLCYTGLRVTEFCQLTKFNYDPREKTLRCGIKTEAGTDRVVPVPEKIQAIVDGWHSASSGPLYPRASGKAHNKDSFRAEVWRPVMEALGLPEDLTPHSARHTYGTRLSRARVAPEDIQRLMGHADYSTTANVYINQDISTLRKAVNAMD